VTIIPDERNHQDQLEIMSPGDKVMVGQHVYKVMSKKNNGILFLNDEVHAHDKSVLQLRGQTVRYERNADSRMAKRFRELVLAGDCDAWDISLLCFALTKSSHELMHGAEEKVPMIEDLRNLRNESLAHVRSCRMGHKELMHAVAKMDAFVAGCLSTNEWSEWKAVSRQILQDEYTLQSQNQPYSECGLRESDTPFSRQQAQASSQQLQHQRDQDSHRQVQRQHMTSQQSLETLHISCPQQLPQMLPSQFQELQIKQLAVPCGAHFTNMQRATVGAQFGVFRKRQESICQQFWQRELMDCS